MTLYQLIKSVSDIITPDTGTFYKYVLYTSDDNGGFLRTRYFWWDDPIEDRELGDDYKNILVTSKKPIDIKDLEYKDETLIKLQFIYGLKNASIEDAETDIQMGYCYIYLFDLLTKSYIMECRKCPDLIQ